MYRDQLRTKVVKAVKDKHDLKKMISKYKYTD